MPRKNPIPEEEKAICRRLRQFREATGLSQNQFARRVGLNWRAYSNYELERVKLNYAAARSIFIAFPKLDARWLAEGSGHMLTVPYFIAWPLPSEIGAESSVPFGDVYESWLKAKLILSRTAWVKDTDPFPLFRVGDSIAGRVSGKILFAEIVGDYIAKIADGHVDAFLNDAQVAVDNAFEKHNPESGAIVRERARLMARTEALQPPFNISSEDDLTEAATSITNTATMKAQLPSLLERLKKATEASGKKSELAEFLSRVTKTSVPLASVSRWLSGEREPGGEVALQLLRWVELQERGAK